MPISYDEEKGGWTLKDVTEEELKKLIELGKAYLVSQVAKRVAEAAIKEALEHDDDVVENQQLN